MSPSCSPPRASAFSSRLRGGYAHPDMRVSDAERTDVSERLSKHYADGRLDQAEFDERLNRAMNARTHGDFAGLFADLPDLPDPEGKDAPALVAGQRSPRPLLRILLLGLIIVVAAAVGHALVHSFVPWLLIGLLAFLWLRNGPGHRRRL